MRGLGCALTWGQESVRSQGQDSLGGHGRAGRGQGPWCAPDRGAPGVGP